MVEITSYPAGAPSWADAAVADLDEAQQFYGSLLGWQFEAGGAEVGHYTLCTLRGRQVAGLMPIIQEGMSPMWTMYFASDDAAATAKSITEHGGTIIVEPMQVADKGTMCYATDPTGAGFGVWQPANHKGAELRDEHGAVNWYELTTRDGAKADAFYHAVFGQEMEQIGDGKTFNYTVWSVNGQQVCGRMQMDETWPKEIPPYWVVYFGVSDCDAAARRVAELNGKVTYEPFDTPYGRIAIVADPGGAVFSLIDPSKTESVEPAAA